MPMRPFVELFPEQGARETRSITVTGHETLPDGPYGYFETYCDEPGCDCRRVILLVLRPETGWRRFWATIGYGWESLDFYRHWGTAPWTPAEVRDMKGPYLDPLNEQSEHAPVLLEYFESTVLTPDYIDRLKRHYQMFREAIRAGAGSRFDQEARRREKRRKRLRDPRRR